MTNAVEWKLSPTGIYTIWWKRPGGKTWEPEWGAHRMGFNEAMRTAASWAYPRLQNWTFWVGPEGERPYGM